MQRYKESKKYCPKCGSRNVGYATECWREWCKAQLKEEDGTESS